MDTKLRDVFFVLLWRQVVRFPKTIIALGVIVAVVAALWAVFFLRLNSNQDDLVASDVPFHKRYLEHLDNFGDQEYLYIVIRVGETDADKNKAKQFAESMARHLRTHPGVIRAVYYRVTPMDLGDGAFLFASQEEAEAITRTVGSMAPFINRWLEDMRLARLLDGVVELFNSGPGDAIAGAPSNIVQGLHALGGLLASIDHTLAAEAPTAPTRPLLDLAGNMAQYFFTKGDQLLIMRLLPAKDYGTMDVIDEPLKVVRQALDAVRTEFPDIQAGLTGRPVLQADEMQTTNRDMTRAALVAIILVGLLFMLVLHGWLRPVLVLISLVMAIAWTFGFATVTVGELNLLSIVFALILVGIGVDFGLHIVMRYVEAGRIGLGVREAVHASMLKTGPGVVLAAVTSVCAFYTVLGSDFRGVAELGLIGGSGILLCLLAMLTVLPAMLLIAGEKNLFPSSVPRFVAMPFMERLTRRPGKLLLILAALSLGALPGVFRAGFSYNLLDLQAKGLESVEYENYLIEASDESTWYAIFTADTLEEVRRRVQTLKALPCVGSVESILDYIPKDQGLKSALYAQAAQALKRIPSLENSSEILDSGEMISALQRLSAALETLEEKLFAAGAAEELALVDKSIAHIQSSLEVLGQDNTKVLRLRDLQNALRGDILALLDQLKRWLSARSVTVDNLPGLLRDIYLGLDGRYQIKVSPSGNVWDFDKLSEFVAHLRQVDPEVSGVPVGVLESARLMHKTFVYAAGLTLLLVSMILWLSSRSVQQTLLTLLPLAVGILWLLGLMGWLGLNFNLANFFGIPILIAIGVDGGVHLLARWRELDGRGGLFLTSTPTAVTLSFATTMIGFGGLLLAHHRGLASLGALMVLGSLTVMLACLLVLPAVLKLAGGSSETNNE